MGREFRQRGRGTYEKGMHDWGAGSGNPCEEGEVQMGVVRQKNVRYTLGKEVWKDERGEWGPMRCPQTDPAAM